MYSFQSSLVESLQSSLEGANHLCLTPVGNLSPLLTTIIPQPLQPTSSTPTKPPCSDLPQPTSSYDFGSTAAMPTVIFNAGIDDLLSADTVVMADVSQPWEYNLPLFVRTPLGKDKLFMGKDKDFWKYKQRCMVKTTAHYWGKISFLRNTVH